MHFLLDFFPGTDTFISSRQRGNTGEREGSDMQQRTSGRNRTRVSCVYGLHSDHLIQMYVQQMNMFSLNQIIYHTSQPILQSS